MQVVDQNVCHTLLVELPYGRRVAMRNGEFVERQPRRKRLRAFQSQCRVEPALQKDSAFGERRVLVIAR